MKRQRHDSSSDESDNDHNASSTRSSNNKMRRHDSSSDSDLSPVRTSQNDTTRAFVMSKQTTTKVETVPSSSSRLFTEDSDGDLSPVRRTSTSNPSSTSTPPPPKPTIGGLKHGIELKNELERKKQSEKEMFDRMNQDLTGKHASTVYRDHEGKKITREQYLESQKHKKKKQGKEDEQEYTKTRQEELPWSSGMVQQRESHELQRRINEESTKPFSRYENDRELESMRMNEAREEDPMAAYLEKKRLKKEEKKRKKREKERRKRKERGEPVSPSSEEETGAKGALLQKKKVYEGRYPPNRYNIRPGHLWDGVNRTNGFEVRLLSSMNQAQARAEVAHKWSTEDM